MKKIMIILMSLLMVAVMMAGCAAQDDPSDNVSENTDKVTDTDGGSVETGNNQEAEDTNTESSDEKADSGSDETSDSSDSESSEDEAPTEEELIAMFRQFREPESGDIIATMTTNFGEIDILFFPEVAPRAVENFTTHAQNGYYDGVTFHRVMNDFMIQGGDPQGTGRGGESIWGAPFNDEFHPLYFPFRGALCMANSGANTNGSQFFIVQLGEARAQITEALEKGGFPPNMVEAYKEYGGTDWLYRKHTVFGQVTSGMDVVDAIAATETGAADKPVEDVVIESITVTEVE